jgi:peptidoglycan/LPS O-acetylase OafA/YrhL/lysophospholipase L1-like esterase
MTTPVAWAPAVRPAERSARASLGYLPGLDGVRGVALIGVLLFHAGHLGGGFLSVDLFFVLSGFLITSLLLVEWDRTGSIDLRRFWSRRLRRLLPAALVVLAATAVYAAIALDPAELHRFRLDALAALANLANWRAIEAGSDYWATFGRPSPLRHMWTLSVEEQLYLLWPATALLGLWVGRRRRWGRQTLLLITLGLAVASAAAMALLVHPGDTARAYYGTDTRASAVLLGAAAAIGLSRREWTAQDPVVRGLRALAPVAVIVLAVGWLWADGEDLALYRWGFVLCSVAATILVGAVATQSSPGLVRALEVAPLRELGRISYGAYLWHWPVFVVLDEPIGGSRAIQTAVRVAISIALGIVSNRLVERPIRSGRVSTARWRPLAILGALGVAVAIGTATMGAEARPTSVAEEGPRGGGAGAPSILLLGDSEAFNLSESARAVLGDQASFAHHARIGCGIGPGLAIVEDGEVVDRDLGGELCSDANGWFYLVVADQDPDIVILHEGAWDVLDRRIGDEEIVFGTERWDEVVRANFAEVLPRLTERGARLYLLAAPCYPPGGEGGGHTIRDDEPRVRRWNELLREVAPTVGAVVLPYDELFCDRPLDEQPEREDGVHLTEEGAAEVWAWLLPQLALERR